MKILHINRNYAFNKLHHLLILNLQKKTTFEHEVFVPTSYEQSVENIDASYVNICKCFSLKDKYFYFRKQRKIMAAIEKSYYVPDYDLVHAYTLFTDGNCAYKLYKKYGIPYVVAVRNTDVNDFYKKIPLLRFRGQKILKNASYVFFLSENYRKKVFDNYISSHYREKLYSKTFIVPNGVDEYWLKNRYLKKRDISLTRLKNKELVIIYAGRIDKNKNIETTIRAIEKLQHQGYKIEFWVVGKNEDQMVFDHILSKDFLKYKGCVDKEQLSLFYREADIFVMPSFTESFGLSYVEAMSQGLPVIYTKGQGFDGQYAEGVVGFHVDPHNDDDICDKIYKIMDNYCKISGNCIRECLNFDWNSIAKEYINIYKKICLGVQGDKVKRDSEK